MSAEMKFDLEFDRETTRSELERRLAHAESFHSENSKVPFRIWHDDLISYLKEHFTDNAVASYFEKEADIEYAMVWYDRMTDADKIASYDLAQARKALRRIIKEISGDAKLETKPLAATTTLSNRVFIVHGHDEKTLMEVKEVLKSQGLVPIILKDEPNGGATIIEKFEKNADVGFSVAILTADDAVQVNDQPGKAVFRARQNVILELGYFVGKLGRSRICALSAQSVELPSDFHGVVYTSLDSGGGWRYRLLDELKHAGYTVDKNKL